MKSVQLAKFDGTIARMSAAIGRAALNGDGLLTKTEQTAAKRGLSSTADKRLFAAIVRGSLPEQQGTTVSVQGLNLRVTTRPSACRKRR